MTCGDITSSHCLASLFFITDSILQKSVFAVSSDRTAIAAHNHHVILTGFSGSHWNKEIVFNAWNSSFIGIMKEPAKRMINRARISQMAVLKERKKPSIFFRISIFKKYVSFS